MADTLDNVIRVLSALRSFHFSSYGCDEVDEILADPSLDLLDDLAAHIAFALED